MSIPGSPFGSPTGKANGHFTKRYNQHGALYPNRNLLAYYKTTITDGKLIAYRPPAGSSTVQVKGSLFSVAVPEDVPYTGIETTDVITVGGGTAPTCAVNGTLSMTANFWDMRIHRAGVLWAYLPGINVGGAFELDASGNGHHLYLTTTTIAEVVDGTGTNYRNIYGYTRSDYLLQHILGDGTGYLANASLTGKETIISNEGTAVVSVSAGKVNVGIGTLWSFALSNGSTYEFATRLGVSSAICFDTSGNGRHLILTSFANLDAACVTSNTDGSNWLNLHGVTVAGEGTHYAENNKNYPIASETVLPATVNNVCAAHNVSTSRLITNELAREFMSTAKISAPFLSAATHTTTSDGYGRIVSTDVSFRSFWTITVNVEAGKRYALRFNVRNVSGRADGGLFSDAGGTGTITNIGTFSANLPVGASSGTIGKVIDCTVSGTKIYRVGPNPSADSTTHPFSAEFGAFMFEEIPSTQLVPSEYIYAGVSAVINTSLSTSVVDGMVVDGQIVSSEYEPEQSVIIMCDSFGNDNFDWPVVLKGVIKKTHGIYHNGISGRTLSQGIADLPDQVTLSAYNSSGVITYPLMQDYVVRPKTLILGLGVNDIIGGASLETMQGLFEQFATAAFANGITYLICIDIPPFKGLTSSTEAKLAIRASFNSWLVTRVEQDSRMALYKISEALSSATDAEVLSATYDSGDHLHPNADGGTLIANDIRRYL